MIDDVVKKNYAYAYDKFKDTMPELAEAIKQGKYLVYLIDFGRGYDVIVDLTRPMIPEHKQYLEAAQQSFQESMDYGLFDNETKFRC